MFLKKPSLKFLRSKEQKLEAQALRNRKWCLTFKLITRVINSDRSAAENSTEANLGALRFDGRALYGDQHGDKAFTGRQHVDAIVTGKWWLSTRKLMVDGRRKFNDWTLKFHSAFKVFRLHGMIGILKSGNSPNMLANSHLADISAVSILTGEDKKQCF